jgi:hypothetical protein
MPAPAVQNEGKAFEHTSDHIEPAPLPAPTAHGSAHLRPISAAMSGVARACHSAEHATGTVASAVVPRAVQRDLKALPQALQHHYEFDFLKADSHVVHGLQDWSTVTHTSTHPGIQD